jgi:hypothetical protein
MACRWPRLCGTPSAFMNGLAHPGWHPLRGLTPGWALCNAFGVGATRGSCRMLQQNCVTPHYRALRNRLTPTADPDPVAASSRRLGICQPGAKPWGTASVIQALKGRDKDAPSFARFYPALSGLFNLHHSPRALPWAGMSQTFGLRFRRTLQAETSVYSARLNSWVVITCYRTNNPPPKAAILAALKSASRKVAPVQDGSF